MDIYRIKGLDGLRAIAALMVFGFHASIPGFEGGTIGVNIFFVLSGYIITFNIINEMNATGRISILAFYFRRMLRLWPVLIIVCLIFSIVLGEQLNIYTEIIPSICYISNWTHVSFGYPFTFVHTWSLSIETQFYLIWPWLLIIILRTNYANKYLIFIGFALIITAYRLYLYLIGTDTTYLYYSFSTRCDALLIGSALALASPAILQQLSRLWPIALIVFIWALVYVTWDACWLYCGGLFGLAMLSASFIAKIVTKQDGWLVKALEFKPVADFGKISYSFYVWHWPILILNANRFGIYKSAFLCFNTSILFAIGSWFLLEKPLLALKHRQRSA